MKKRPSEYVGRRLAELRKRRGWRQEDLVNRLETHIGPGWRQSKIAKIESGDARRLTVDEVCELAAALGVSPLLLITPERGGEDDDQVALGAKVSRTPLMFRQWVRGSHPLFRYSDPDEQEREERFYFFESQPLDEWRAQAANERFRQQVAELIENTTNRGESK